jgi:hypothetical protein
MPVWLQLLIPAALLALAFGRQPTSPVVTNASINESNVTRGWRTYYALQTCVISLSRSIESVDAMLGVLMAIIASGFFYLLDRAREEATRAQYAHQPVAHYPFVFGWLLLAPLTVAFITVGRLLPEEPLDARVFVERLQEDETATIQTMLSDMVGVYDRNYTLRRRKQVGLFLVVGMVLALLVLDAAWPHLVNLVAYVLKHLVS